MVRRFQSNHHAVLGVLVVCFGILAGPAWATKHFTDEANGVGGQLFGAAACELEDQNGDGRWEFLIGAPGDDVGGTNVGAVFLWFGGADYIYAPTRVWRGQPRDDFGFSVARIGDVNGDGDYDWAVGAPAMGATGVDRPGRVYVFYGGSTPPTTWDLVFDGVNDDDWFGYAVSAAGDFDGDGNDDFIIGAPGANVGATENGAAWVIYGVGSGNPSTDLADALELPGPAALAHFGWSVCVAGNFLGGNPVSIAVGAPDHNSPAANAGEVFVYEGTLGGTPDAIADHQITTSYTTNPANGSYGFVVRNAGRWDSDSYDDLVIGAPNMNAGATANGRVEIVFGDPNPSTTGDRYINGANANDALGYALAGVRDVSGSSAADVLIGAPFRDVEATDAGRAGVWEGGSSSGSATSLEVLPISPLVPGTEAGDNYGFAVSSVGDFDGDGLWDMAVGAPVGNIANNATAGFCHILDSSGLIVPTFLARWQADWTPTGAVRLDFALGVPAEEVVYLRLDRRADGVRTLVYEGRVGDGTVAISTEGFTVLDAAPPLAARDLTYRLEITTRDGATRTLVALDGPEGAAPLVAGGLAIGDVWPNPANPQVSIRFRADPDERVACRIYDLRGHLVRELHAGPANGAWQTVVWDGRSDRGESAPSGSYLVMLQGESTARTRRVTLAR